MLPQLGLHNIQYTSAINSLHGSAINLDFVLSTKNIINFSLSINYTYQVNSSVDSPILGHLLTVFPIPFQSSASNKIDEFDIDREIINLNDEPVSNFQDRIEDEDCASVTDSMLSFEIIDESELVNI